MKFVSKLAWRAAFSAMATAFVGATPGCSFPDHRFSDENCFNGIDDDANGLADCDDPACNALVACVPAVPSGWQGPVAIWEGGGSESPPSCADSQYPVVEFQQLFAGPTTPAATCPTCDCTGAPTTDASSCVTRVQLSDASDCSGSQQMLGPDGLPGFVVTTDCTVVPVSNQFSPQTAFYTTPTAQSDVCVSQSTNQAVIPPATFDKSLRACGSPESTPAGCSASQQTCVPRPQAGYSPMICVYQEGDSVNCPGPYDMSLPFYRYQDNRQCSACSCTPSGISCESASSADQSYVGSYDADSSCLSTPFQIVSQSTGCVNHAFTPGVSVYMKLVNTVPKASGTPACQPNPSTVIGGVTAAQSVTFCCLNP